MRHFHQRHVELLPEGVVPARFVARAPGPAQPLPPDQMEMSSLMTIFETMTAASLASVAKVRSFSSFEPQSPPVTGSPNTSSDKSFESRDHLYFMLARKMAASQLGVDIIAKSSSSSAGGNSEGGGGDFALASAASVDSVSHAWLLGQQPESLAKTRSFDKNYLSPLKYDPHPSFKEIFSAEENGQTQIFLLFPLLGGCSFWPELLCLKILA